jgi:hypothetical protein
MRARAPALHVYPIRCFTHDELVAAFGDDDWDVDLLGRTARVCHKHCLHSFNFVIKARFDDFRASSKFGGSSPDVCCVMCAWQLPSMLTTSRLLDLTTTLCAVACLCALREHECHSKAPCVPVLKKAMLLKKVAHVRSHAGC